MMVPVVVLKDVNVGKIIWSPVDVDEIPVVPEFANERKPCPVADVPTVRTINSKTALNGTFVPDVAAADVTADAISPSAVVPAVPNLSANVLVFAPVEVQVPSKVTLITVPATSLFTGNAAVLITTVSVVLMPEVAVIMEACPLLAGVVHVGIPAPPEVSTWPEVPTGVTDNELAVLQTIPPLTAVKLAFVPPLARGVIPALPERDTQAVPL